MWAQLPPGSQNLSSSTRDLNHVLCIGRQILFFFFFNFILFLMEGRFLTTGLPGKSQASLVAQLVKSPPAMQEIPVQFLGQEDPLEKGSAQFSRSVVSDSLRSHEPPHARPPCPSPTPRVYANSCPLSQ